MQELETTNTTVTTTTTTTTTTTNNNVFADDMDSACSTPYVSAPSSPGHGQPLSGYYYSAPASPMHFVLPTTTFTSCNTSQAEPSSALTFEFDFSAKLKADGATSPESMTMSSADELFFNGQIRPMKLSTHLQRPQILSPLLDIEENDQDSEDQDHDQGCVSRGRDVKFRDKWTSMRSRRTRSLSPLRTASFEWQQKCENYDEIITTQNEEKEKDASDEKHHDQYEEVISSEATPCNSGSSSWSSSVGRSSKRWVLLKEFLYRSKSEGRNNGHKFWNGLSFSSPVKDKKMENMKMVKTPRMKPSSDDASSREKCVKSQQNIAVKDPKKRVVNGKAMNGVMRKRRVPPSAHELHYTANRAQSEEMRKKTFLPYRQGLLGCLGFSSKSYGAWNGFARALNPVSSR